MSDLLNRQLTTGPSYADLLIGFINTTMPQYKLTPWQERFVRAYFKDATDPDPEPVKPCNCYYGLHNVDEAPVSTMVAVRRPGVWRPVWLTRCFVIVWDCPHHGDAALKPLPACPEAEYFVTLDEDERTGN